MSNNKPKIALIGIGLLSALFCSIVFAQTYPEYEIVKKNADGSYIIKIEGHELLALPKSMEKGVLNMDTELNAAKNKIEAKDNLLKTYAETIAKYDSTMNYMRDYISELEGLLNGYKNLLKDYKKMKNPWVTLNWGIGATSNNYRPAVLMGIGIRKLQLSGFVQERNLGFLVGTQFKLF